MDSLKNHIWTFQYTRETIINELLALSQFKSKLEFGDFIFVIVSEHATQHFKTQK